MSQTERLGVTGASGRLATLVVEYLLAELKVEPSRLVLLSRSPDKLGALARRGAEVRAADFDQPADLPSAMSGIDRLLLISTDEIFPIGTRARQQASAVEAATLAGVGHIVYTSAPNPEPPNPMFWEEDHWLTEQAIRASGCGWTFLRNSEYTEIHLERHWPDAIARGELHTIAGNGRCAYVSRVDCARAAAVALSSSSSGDAIYDITGPEALSADEAMVTIGEVTGERIEVIHSTPDDYRTVLEKSGQPDWLIPCWIGLEQGIESGLFETVSPDFTEVTGLPATSFRDVVSQYLGSGDGAQGAPARS